MNSKNSNKPILGLLFSSLIFGTLAFMPTRAEAQISPSSIIQLTNNERAALGLGSLTENTVLAAAAQAKANDMASVGYFSHNTPDGQTPWQFMDEAGYKYSSAGENLAVDYLDNGILVKAWMNSPGHRANIVNGAYEEIGVAYARGVYQGRDTIFVVQMFGVPKTSTISRIAEVVSIPTVQSVKSEVLAETAPTKIENTPQVTPVVVEVKETPAKEITQVSVDKPITQKPVQPKVIPTSVKKPTMQIAKAETNDVLGTMAAKVGTTTLVQKKAQIKVEADLATSSQEKKTLAERKTTALVRTTLSIVSKIGQMISSLLARFKVTVN